MENMEFLKATLAEMKAKMVAIQDKLDADRAKMDAETKAIPNKLDVH
jgi:membrane protein insertase Oxa1/YidC/SpoIIIJ